MEDLKFGWRDEFYDDEFRQAGRAILFRNPLISAEYNENGELISANVKYSTPPSIPNEPILSNQTFIAQGFTAYAKKCNLLYKIKNNDRPITNNLFNSYLNTVLAPERKKNNIAFKPKTGIAFDIELLQNHIEAEREKLKLSHFFYSECTSDDDYKIKAEVHAYAKFYLEWLEDNLNKLKAKLPHNKVVIAFSDYFVERYKETLPEICKTVFNARNSPKDYAIMVCLLKEKYLLSFTPTHLYKSWYIFIGRAYKEGANFNEINKTFIERVVGEFDTYDSDYKTLKKVFEKALKDNNIT